MNPLFKYLFIFAFVVGVVPAQTHAQTNAPEAFVNDISNKVLDIIKNDKSDSEKEKQLTLVFESSVDSVWMGRFALGKYFRQASEEEQKRYLELYHEFLVRSYIPRFREYTGQNYKILGVQDKGNGHYIVQTELISQDATAVRVDYRLKANKESNYKVVDVIGEGISLITTQRSDFGGLISRKGVSYFIDRLNDKVRKISAPDSADS